MFLVRLAFKNLTRHKRRTLITAGVIAVAIFFYIFLDSMMLGMTNKSFQSIINFDSGHLQIVNSNYWEEKEDLPLENLISLENEELVKGVRSVDGYREMAPQLSFSANLNNGVDELPVKVKGIMPEKEKKVFTTEEYFVEGSMFANGEYKAVMGKDLAHLMDLKMGDYVTLLVRTKEETFNTIDAQIAGLLQTPNPEINENVVFVPLDIAQKALNVDNKVSQIIVRLDNRTRAEKVATLLSEEFSEQDLPIRAYSWRKAAEFIVNMSKAQQTENQTILGIILLIAAVGIVNTVILSALERMEEIGMMKALGLKVKEIVFVFSLEAAGIGIIGGLIGCIMGVIIVGFFHTYGIDFFALGGGDMPTFGIPIMGRIYGGWNLESFVFVFSFGVLVSILVSIPPALWAARKDPVKAIYHR